MERNYRYGMRLRGFAPGCQPMMGLLKREDDPTGKYWDILFYGRELSEEELENYEMERIVEMKKYEIDFYDYETGATSAIDTVNAPEGYTPEQYIEGCRNNADDDWNEMLNHGTVSVVEL